MRHIREIDPQHTVIMVQVENETGSYGNPRDFSPDAQRLFDAAHSRRTGAQDRQERDMDSGVRLESRPGVQRLVHCALRRRGRRRRPGRAQPADVRQRRAQRSIQGRRRAIWRERRAELERARHLEGGRAAPFDRSRQTSTTATTRRSRKQLDHYARPDNPLFVPENGNDPDYARFFWLALGKGAIGWAPFGMDATGYFNFPLGAKKLDADDARGIRVQISPARADRARLGAAVVRASDDRLRQAEDGADQSAALGRWRVTAMYGMWEFGERDWTWIDMPPNPNKDQPVGGAAIIQLGPDEFLVAGSDVRIRFGLDKPQAGDNVQFLEVEEGTFDERPVGDEPPLERRSDRLWPQPRRARPCSRSAWELTDEVRSRFAIVCSRRELGARLRKRYQRIADGHCRLPRRAGQKSRSGWRSTATGSSASTARPRQSSTCRRA